MNAIVNRAEFDSAALELADLICENSSQRDLCDKRAREISGTTGWSEQDFEEQEDSAQYKLYWTAFAETQAALLRAVQDRLVVIIFDQ